jgi:hypothetical protein
MMVSDWERRPTVKQLLQLTSVQNAMKVRSRDLYIASGVSDLRITNVYILHAASLHGPMTMVFRPLIPAI